MPQADSGRKVEDLADVVDEVVSSNIANQRFGELCTRAQHGDERFLVTRHGRPAAGIVSLKDLELLRHARPAA